MAAADPPVTAAAPASDGAVAAGTAATAATTAGTADAPAVPVLRAPPGADVGAGRTTVAERAVQRIAVRVLADFEHVGGGKRRLLGVGMGGGSEARVRARLHGQSAASLAVRCSIPYPVPVRQATEAVRDELRRRIPELTGLAVRRVDITVTSLSTGNGTRVR